MSDSAVDHAIIRRLLGLRGVDNPVSWKETAKMFRRKRIRGKYGTTYTRIKNTNRMIEKRGLGEMMG